MGCQEEVPRSAAISKGHGYHRTLSWVALGRREPLGNQTKVEAHVAQFTFEVHCKPWRLNRNVLMNVSCWAAQLTGSRTLLIGATSLDTLRRNLATDLRKANEPALRGVDGAEGPSEPAAGGLFRCLMDPPDGEEVTADIQYVYEALHDQGAHFSHESTEPRCCVTPRRSQGFEDSVITKLFPIYGMEPELEGILTCFSPRLPQPCSFISGVIPFLPAFSGSAALSSETSP